MILTSDCIDLRNFLTTLLRLFSNNFEKSIKSTYYEKSKVIKKMFCLIILQLENELEIICRSLKKCLACFTPTRKSVAKIHLIAACPFRDSKKSRITKKEKN